MLSRRESEVMQAVFSLCREEGRCLVAPADLLRCLPAKQKYTEEKLEKIQSMKPGTLLVMKNHVVMYIGQENGEDFKL